MFNLPRQTTRTISPDNHDHNNHHDDNQDDDDDDENYIDHKPVNVKVSRTGEDKSTFVAPVYKSTFTIDIKEKITVQGAMDQTRPDQTRFIEVDRKYSKTRGPRGPNFVIQFVSISK